MPSNEQRRQAAKRKLERQLERRAVRAKRRRVIGVSVTVVAVLAVVGGIYWLATMPDSTDAAANPSESSTTPPPPGKTTDGPCKYAESPGEPAAKEAGLPADPNPTPNQGKAEVNFKTNQGDIGLTLDKAKAPCTVQSFTHLVAKKYYDNTVCHRLTTTDGLKVLQCGDPKGTGQGGPGYTIKDEKPTDLKPGSGQGASVYPRGTLAMAKTAAPDSGGSQFFMVYADSQLPPEYTVFGTVNEAGLQILDKVAGAGADAGPSGQPGDGKPKSEVKIELATLKS
ncbi:peptidyl-prolyl cis-trans isomerase B (cyclophilin B) [Crossiella equi]|uniref:Peptidyl-prolyl cis-trans isomerase B (Cyclophilin B) n=1 Tax=Crossiella equi TaxID=130796 RepID=A0ABS5ANR1_9PSEU|nr:peptidylprolyl isomerase [Crossiella equi]MBP2478175.1 peptidyl-prolyl cis-trans isomerase B (cyclophilin B) [Crossiella equi]